MLGTELKAIAGLALGEATARVANAVAPISNGALHAKFGADPVVWIGGLTSRSRDYLGLQRCFQERGIPFYLVDTGRGFNPIAKNAAEAERVVEQALAETGASRAWIAGQSKGTIEARELLQHSPVANAIRGAFLVVGPHGGGLTTSERFGAIMRGAHSRLPGFVQDRLRAFAELTPGSEPLTRLNDEFRSFLAQADDDFRIHNYVSDVMPVKQVEHDLLVPLSSQRLPEHPKVVEHQLSSGALNHVTAHLNREVVDSMADTVFAAAAPR